MLRHRAAAMEASAEEAPAGERLLPRQQASGAGDKRRWLAARPGRARLNRPSAGQLINCMSEYFASRNVINRSDLYEQLPAEPAPSRPSETNRPSRRAQPVQRQQRHRSSNSAQSAHEQQQQQQQQRRPARQQQFDLINWRPAGGSNGARSSQHQAQHQAQPMSKRQLVKRLQPAVGAGSRKEPKRAVLDLLKELLSARRNTSRLRLVARLLRAPIVLAALFSFCLALSLITLYALSFHHCQPQSAGAARDAHYHTVSSRHLSSGGNSSAARSAASQSSPHLARPPPPPPAIVQTECGPVEARDDGPGGLVFSGIPYASPPVGELRWRRPRPIWLDRKLCEAHKSATGRRASSPVQRAHCVQLSPFNRRVSGSEDCLYLDVYAPKVSVCVLLDERDAFFGPKPISHRHAPIMLTTKTTRDACQIECNARTARHGLHSRRLPGLRLEWGWWPLE